MVKVNPTVRPNATVSATETARVSRNAASVRAERYRTRTIPITNRPNSGKYLWLARAVSASR